MLHASGRVRRGSSAGTLRVLAAASDLSCTESYIILRSMNCVLEDRILPSIPLVGGDRHDPASLGSPINVHVDSLAQQGRAPLPRWSEDLVGQRS